MVISSSSSLLITTGVSSVCPTLLPEVLLFRPLALTAELPIRSLDFLARGEGVTFRRFETASESSAGCLEKKSRRVFP
jgi:hypothetical protein